MQEIIEKIIERLSKMEKKPTEWGIPYINYSDALKEVKKVAEECDNGWISIKKKLPEVLKPVLITDTAGDVEIAYRTATGWKYVDHNISIHPTAWQPLPQPYIPKEEKKQ